MKRFVFINGLVALVAAATIGVLAGGTAHALFYCTGDISGKTINDSVVVPAGAFCTSSHDTHISGDVIVQPGGDLDFQSVDPSRTTVGGSVYLRGVSDISELCGTTINGSLYIQNNAHAVDVGSLNCIAPTNVIKGSVYAQYNTSFVTLGDNTISQGVFISHNSGLVNVNVNTIGTSLSATVNTGGGAIQNNTITGSLTAIGNNPPYSVTGNAVGGFCDNNGTHVC